MNAALIVAYTRRVIRARKAYAADMAVADGFCAVCLERPRAGHTRRCVRCTDARRYEGSRR